MTNWKALAISSWIVLLIGISFIGWGWYLTEQEENQMNECYYDICNNYPEAWLDGDICFCYEYDVLDNLIVSKTTYMKD